MQGRQKSISYRSKDISQCPVCNQEFQREMMHSGGGRLIAGKLTADLRRLYEPNRKYGKVYPQAYSIMVCPQCLFASFPNDFGSVHEQELSALGNTTPQRRTAIERLLGPIDFNEDRTIVSGIASYLLAIDCYQRRGPSVAPTAKKGICCMRAGWLLSDLHEEFPEYSFDQLSEFMHIKAVDYYLPLLDIMSNGREPHDQFVPLLGPDTDNNWGFDGVIYINGYLAVRHINKLAPDEKARIELLEKNKRYLGKLYGMGRASKNKPSILIDMAKDLYEDVSQQLSELTGEPVEL